MRRVVPVDEVVAIACIDRVGPFAAFGGVVSVLKVQDEPTEVVIFKEEDAPIQLIIDLIEERAESNAQEVELAHQNITYNIYGRDRAQDRF